MGYVINNTSEIEVDIDEYGSISLISGNSNLLVTSKYNYIKEEERFLNKIDENMVNQVFIIFGLGTGNWLKLAKIKQLVKKNKIIVVEPVVDVYKSCKKEYLEGLNDNLLIYVGDEFAELSKYVSIFGGERNNLQILYFGNYKNCYPEIYKNLLEVLRNHAILSLTRYATMRRFNRLFTSNIINNLFENIEYSKINNYKKVFEGIPALIISAGPSLDKQLDKIKNFNGIIFSGGRTLKTLVELGVNPDFFVSIDPQKNAFYLVEDSINLDIPIITGTSSNHDIIKKYNGDKILMNSVVDSRTDTMLDFELDRINFGSSVANATFSVAEYMGCNPIVFIGQDLAMTGGKHHSGKTLNKRFDGLNEVDLTKINLTVDGYYGELVQTRPDLFSFLQWFEDKISRIQTEVINCTEGGAKIKGTVQMPFSNYLATEYNQKRIIQEAYTGVNDEKLYITDEIEEREMNQINEVIDILYTAKRKATSLSEKYMNKMTKEREINSILRQLDKTDKELVDIGRNNVFLSYIVVDALNRFHTSIKSNKQRTDTINKQIAKSTEEFYTTLYEDVNFVKDEMLKVIGEQNAG